MILNGREISKKRNLKLKEEISKNLFKRPPCLAIVLVGNNPASAVYVKNKVKKANFVGITTKILDFPETIDEKSLETEIIKLNKNNDIDGIIIQLPLPKHLNENILLDLVDLKKDVDGFSLVNQGLLFQGRKTVLAATPQGILNLLDEYKIDVLGKNVVVIGTSLIVGRPIGLALLERNATVTFSHIHTKNLKKLCKESDIIISAAGVVDLIKKSMVKKDSIIIDVGINFKEGKTVGDCDYINIFKKVKYITPVPGGIGPMTINALLENTYKAFKQKMEEKK